MARQPDNSRAEQADRVPPVAFSFGIAGLLPQVGVFLAILSGDAISDFLGATAALIYGGSILSFLGGLWWGLAAAPRDKPPSWIYVAAVIPSLVALALPIVGITTTFGFPLLGLTVPLFVLGIALIASLAIDYRLWQIGIAPVWWMKLRIPLSLGLGGMTLAVGVATLY